MIKYDIAVTAPGRLRVPNEVPAPIAGLFDTQAEAWFALFDYMAAHYPTRLNRDKVKLFDFSLDLLRLGQADIDIFRYTIQPIVRNENDESDR
ncbi:hypothetical protein AB0M29_37735 [Streptomyces sp. NPDC051976]|uniref:hypothetical protein n=1 Tax=Streptomyces sp. NPDC051976 TaxID=3154947 RepID=UPI00343B462B